MDSKLYTPLFDFCAAASSENEKRIAHIRLRGRFVPKALIDNQKLFSINKWTMMEGSLLCRAFIAKEFDDNLVIGWKQDKIESVSILHMLTDKVAACETCFSLSKIGFFPMFTNHEAWMREKKAKLLIYPIEEGYTTATISKYLDRKGTRKPLRKIKTHENLIKFNDNFMRIFYLKISKKESFMTLMKELL